MLATDQRVSRDELLAAVRSQGGGVVKVDGFASMADDLYTGTVLLADVPVMTDAYAPTDSLISVR